MTTLNAIDHDKWRAELRAQIEELRTTNATLMHQNADLTRENQSLKSQIKNLCSSVKSVDKALNAEGTTPPQTTERTNTMPTDTDHKDPNLAADQEPPAPELSEPPRETFLDRAKEIAGEAIDKAQEKLGLATDSPKSEHDPEELVDGLLRGAQAISDSLTPRPLSAFLNDVIAAAKTAKENEEGTLNISVEIMVQERGNAAKLAFTL